MIYDSVYNLIFATKFSSIYLAKDKNVWFFNYHLLTCSVRKMQFICLMQNIDMWLLYKSHQIARLVSHLIITFSSECLQCNKKMLLNYLVAKMKFYKYFYIIK